MWIGVLVVSVVTLSLALLAAPLVAAAQQPGKVWRIGFLSPQARPAPVNHSHRAFLSGMRDLGYAEGKDFILEWRFADGQYDRLPGLAAELIRLDVDVLIASSSPAIRAAQQATTTIPIVFPGTGDPVGSGFVKSLARPGGNITGVSNENAAVSAKLLELLKEVMPKLARLALLGNPGSSTYLTQLKIIQTDAHAVGVQVLPAEARTPEEIDRAFAGMPQKRAEAVMFIADAFLIQQRQQIADLALKHRLPSITQQRSFPEAGGLMSYGNTSEENMQRTVAIVVKILKGAKPADIPVEQPTKFELVLNLKTAKALGVTIPPSLTMRAARAIE